MDKELKRDYAALAPTIMEPHKVHNYLDEILIDAASGGYNDKDIAGALLEMIFRLSDTYSKLDNQISERIFSWVKEHWSATSIDYVDILCSILANLERQKALDFIKEKEVSEKNIEVKNILVETIEELSVEKI